MRADKQTNQPQKSVANLKKVIKKHGGEDEREAFIIMASMIPPKTTYPRLQAFKCALEARLELEKAQVHSIVHVSHCFCVCNDMAWPVSLLC